MWLYNALESEVKNCHIMNSTRLKWEYFEGKFMSFPSQDDFFFT